MSLGLDSVQLRDARYDHVIHMVTAAIGAEAFYQVTNNDTRKEGIEQARERDTKSAQVGWYSESVLLPSSGSLC